MVSMVMPETGLRAVVAIALAATEAKKNENTSVSTRPIASTAGDGARLPKKTAAPSAVTTTPMQDRHHRDVAVGALQPRLLAVPERAGGDREGAGHDAQRLQDAEDAGGGDGADADEAHVAAEDLLGRHLRRCGIAAGIDGAGRRKCCPIIQMSGTSTKLRGTPPAHRIIEERRPIT